MQILENQCLYLRNLISYKTTADYSNLQELINHVYSNVCRLQADIKDNVIFTFNGNQKQLNTEILIPVDRNINECEHYSFKPVYKLNNAVVIRHEGNLSCIPETIVLLENYIIEKAYHKITDPYCRVIRNSSDNDAIVDIYIGLDCNIL